MGSSVGEYRFLRSAGSGVPSSTAEVTVNRVSADVILEGSRAQRDRQPPSRPGGCCPEEATTRSAPASKKPARRVGLS
jgi:hypothetical protein